MQKFASCLKSVSEKRALWWCACFWRQDSPRVWRQRQLHPHSELAIERNYWPGHWIHHWHWCSGIANWRSAQAKFGGRVFRCHSHIPMLLSKANTMASDIQKMIAVVLRAEVHLTTGKILCACKTLWTQTSNRVAPVLDFHHIWIERHKPK